MDAVYKIEFNRIESNQTELMIKYHGVMVL